MSVWSLVAVLLCALWPLCESLRQGLAWRALRTMPKRSAANVEQRIEFSEFEVLQPIRSGDLSLGEALNESLTTLGARGARLHWLIDEDDAEASRIVEALLNAQPTLREQVVLSRHPPCPNDRNPKLFKLDRALANCDRDFVLVLDDDARLPPDTLRALRDALDHDSARPIIATALPAYLPAPGLGARLLARFVNDSAAITYLPPRLGPGAPTINGMCWAMRRDALLAIGGFAPHVHRLTDDLAMARAVLQAGGRIEQRSEPVWLRTALPNFAAYVRQMHRWMLFARLLLRTEPVASRIRIALGQGVPTLAPAMATAALVSAPSALTAIGWLGGAVAYVLGRRALRRAYAGAHSALQPFSSLLVALALPLHLIHASIDTRIRWRSHRYRVLDDDRFEEIE